MSASLSRRRPESPNRPPSSPPEEVDPETQAFVEEMNDNWEQRKGKSVQKDVSSDIVPSASASSSLYSLDNIKRDYKLTKQNIHAGLWVKDIEKLEEAKLGESISGADDMDKLLDSALPTNNGLGDPKIPGSPDGWENTSSNVWDILQIE